MMLRSKIATFLGAMLVATAGFSAPKFSCPDIKELQNEGLIKAEQVINNYFFAYNANSYDTTSNWMFALGPIRADTDDEALEMGEEILSNMSAQGVPDGYLYCTYNTNNPNIIAVAVKDKDVLKLKQLFKDKTL